MTAVLPTRRRPARLARGSLTTGLAVAVGLVGLAGLAACTTEPEPDPTATTQPTLPARPTATTSVEPGPTGPTLDPNLPTVEFSLPTGAQVEVNEVVLVAVDGIASDERPRASFTVSGAGFDEFTVWGELGQVADIPGWGLLTVEAVEGEPVTAGGGRPPTTLHFRAQPVAPPVFTSTFTLEPGALTLTDLPRLQVDDDGASGGVASFRILPPDGGAELEVSGPAGTAVEVPGWGTITVVEPDPDESDDPDNPGALRIRTTTDFPALNESAL